MENIINHTSHSLESFSFEALTQCISTIHSALQTSAVNAVNRFAAIRNWLQIRPIVDTKEMLDDSILDAMPAEYESDRLRLVRFESPLTIAINGRKFHGIVAIP